MLKVPAEGLFASTAFRTCALAVSQAPPVHGLLFLAHLDALSNDLDSE